MKRRISLLLAVAMILGSFSFAFAADEINPGKFLEEKGILKGDKNGDLMLEKSLLRRDSVVLLSRLMGVEKEAKGFETTDKLPTFKDITDNHYRGYLAWAQSNKYINGHSEERFGFNENLTTKQYAAVLLRALGYVEEAEDWKALFETAKKLGLVEKVEKEADAEITRGEMAQMTFNALGVKVKGEDKTLAEKLEVKMPAPEKLEVKEVKAENLKEIIVVFNKNVDKDVVEDIDLYTTTAGSIKDAQLVEEDTVILTLEGEMKNKKEYKLTIRGFKDAGSEVNNDFKFVAIDNTIPEVVDVVGLGTKAIKVVMSEPVKEPKASNFAIDGKTYYGSVKVTGREIILRPFGRDFSVGEHTLVVKSLEDFNGFKSVEKEIKFEILEDKEAPTVVDIKGTMERIVVTFSEDVDDKTVSKDSVYWGGVKSNKADSVVRLSGNRYAFEFSGRRTLPTYETKVTVKEVKDYSGNEMREQEVVFRAEIDQTRPEVLDIDVDEDKIEVKFNKRVKEDDATDKKNYTLTDKDGKKVSIKDLELSEDGRTVTIKLYSKLSENEDYTLEVTGIRDNTKLANTILPHKETINAGNYNRPEIDAVTANKEKRTIHILFNKEMDIETVANPANYMIAHKDGKYALDALKGDVDVIQGGKAVILYLPEKIDDVKVEKMTFGEKGDIRGVILSGAIKDTAGNRVKKYGEVKGFTEGEVTATAKATDKRTIELEFSHPVTDARIRDFVVEGFKIDRVKVDGTKNVYIETEKDLDPALKDVTLKISDDNKIETVLENKVKEQEIKLVDEIKPSLEKVTGKVYKKGDKLTKLVLELEFDEKLSADYEELAKRDLVVKRASNGKNINMIKDDVKTYVKKDGKETTNVLVLETTQQVSKDTAYEVEIVDPSGIRDMAKNAANKTDGAVIAEKLTVVEEKEEPAEKPEADEKEKEAKATKAVEELGKVEEVTAEKKAEVQKLVNALKDGDVKKALQAKLDKIVVKEPEKPAEEPAEKPEEPAEEPAEKPAEKPAEEPAEKPAEKPAEEPAEKPADK